MVRLFLKLYGPLLLAILVIVVAQSQVFGYVSHRYGADNVRLSFLSVFNLVEKELQRVDTRDWDSAFEMMRPDFGHPIALSDSAGVTARFSPGDTRVEQLTSKKVVIWGDDDGGYSVARRIGADDRVLVLTFAESRHIGDNFAKLNAVVQWLVLTMLLVFWVWPLLRDMRRLQLAAKEIGRGKFHSPPVVGRWSVLADLQQALSAMAHQISALLRSQKALTSGISHELRNPLMRIQFSHRLALDAPTIQAKTAYLSQMEGDLDAMHGLVDEVLEFSKMEFQEETLKLTSQNLPVMVDRQMEKFATLAAVFGRQIAAETAIRVNSCHMDAHLMDRALGNLLSNAARFATSRIKVSASRSAGWNEISVEDDGPGIDQADAERVFRPFERLDESRDRATGGFGLGLAIVREVARLHGGAATVARGTMGGARFTIGWPERGQNG